MEADLDLLSTGGPSPMLSTITRGLPWWGRHSVGHSDLLVSALPWTVPTPPHPWPKKGSSTASSSPWSRGWNYFFFEKFLPRTGRRTPSLFLLSRERSSGREVWSAQSGFFKSFTFSWEREGRKAHSQGKWTESSKCLSWSTSVCGFGFIAWSLQALRRVLLEQRYAARSGRHTTTWTFQDWRRSPGRLSPLSL